MKNKIRKVINENIIAVFIVVCVLFCVFIFFSSKEPSVKEILISIVSFVGVFGVFFQIKKTSDLSTGEFILNLQAEFSTNENHTELFLKCWNSWKYDQGKIFTEKDNLQIINYLTFFESLYIMVKNNVLTIEMLDELFGRRFFVVVNNIEIQEKELGKNYMYYLNIYRLHAMWKAYRIKNNSNVFGRDKDINEQLTENTNIYFKDLQLVLNEKDFCKIKVVVEKNDYKNEICKRCSKKARNETTNYKIYNCCPINNKKKISKCPRCKN